MATTTPNYGWDVPTSTDYVKDGATAIETLGDDIDASLFSITGGKNVGLQHLNTTTFTSVSSISVNSVFTSSYDNYRIELNITNANAFAGALMRLRASGTDSTTGYANANPIFTAGSSSISYQTNTGAAEFQMGFFRNSTDGNAISIDLFNPQKASFTTALGNWADINQLQFGSVLSAHKVNTAYDGFTIAGATITGTVRTYGYRNS